MRKKWYRLEISLEVDLKGFGIGQMIEREKKKSRVQISVRAVSPGKVDGW